MLQSTADYSNKKRKCDNLDGINRVVTPFIRIVFRLCSGFSPLEEACLITRGLACYIDFLLS